MLYKGLDRNFFNIIISERKSSFLIQCSQKLYHDSNHNRSDDDHFEKPTHIRNILLLLHHQFVLLVLFLLV